MDCNTTIQLEEQKLQKYGQKFANRYTPHYPADAYLIYNKLYQNYR
jgi:hypothetical protein